MVHYTDFPDRGTLDEQIEFVLHYAVRAPSTHNSQPWLFHEEKGTLTIYPDWSRKLPEGDKDGRDMFVSLGACVEHALIAFRYFGMLDTHVINEHEVTLSSREPVATLNLHVSEGRDEQLLPLITAIEGRINARGPFLTRPVTADTLELIRKMSEADVVSLLSTDKEDVVKFAKLTALGMHEAHQSRAFRGEIANWMINNYSSKKEGIPGYTMLAPGPLSVLLPWLIGTFNMGPVLAKLNTKSITSASGVGIITSTEDNTLSWLRVGMLFQRISLHLNIAGIRTSIFVASIEVPSLRLQVRTAFSLNGVPQFTFAFGFPKITFKQSPRRDPKERMI